jgi:serine/threonine protein kinase
MAPEQARGKAVDSRADIWAFGVTVYEMHTGKPLFAGASVSEVLASILRDGPNWETLPHDTPASVRTLLRRCLQKDPQLRLRHAGDARLELTDADLSPPPPATAPRGPLSWTGAALFGIAVAAVSLVTALLVVTRFQKAPELPVRKWIIPQESGDDVFGRENVPAISPDGRRVAYTDGERLRIRDLTSFDPREVQVAGTAGMPGWSPDGEFVAFFTDHKYLAYMSDETGTDEIFVRSFPEGHGKRQVSTDGGWWPRWRGTEIFFVEKTTLMAASVRTTPSLQVDAPKALFRLEDRARTGPIFDTLDGQRFIVARTIKSPQNGIAIVQNWIAEFKK